MSKKRQGTTESLRSGLKEYRPSWINSNGSRKCNLPVCSGLRAIVPTVQNVRELEKYYKKYRLKDKSKQHILKRQYDYISEPKESGYRGIHFVYEYCSPQEEYNGLQIEIQLRSRLQHLWATAVETVGFFFQESLKSSQGNQNWLIFLS